MIFPGEIPDHLKMGDSRRLIHDVLTLSESKPARYSLHLLDRIRNAEYAEWSALHNQQGFPDFSLGIQAASKVLQQNMMQSPDEDITHSLRAKASLVLIDEFFYAPVLFSSDQTFRDERHDLLQDNAQYERLGIVLADTMNVLESYTRTSRSTSTLRGLIQELTIATLLNRKTSSLDSEAQLALLAGFEKDHIEKTDLELFSLQFGYLPIQVKSSGKNQNLANITPERGIVLFAKDFYNESAANFVVSRLIVEELSGQARPEVSPLLDAVQTHVLETIETRRHETLAA